MMKIVAMNHVDAARGDEADQHLGKRSGRRRWARNKSRPCAVEVQHLSRDDLVGRIRQRSVLAGQDGDSPADTGLQPRQSER